MQRATQPNTQATATLDPLGPLLTTWQLAWQQMETNLLIHFGINTFTNQEWGDGMESPSIFNPTRLNCC